MLGLPVELRVEHESISQQHLKKHDTFGLSLEPLLLLDHKFNHVGHTERDALLRQLVLLVNKEIRAVAYFFEKRFFYVRLGGVSALRRDCPHF